MKSIFEFDDSEHSFSCFKNTSFSTISQRENSDRFTQNENDRLVIDTRLFSKRPSLDFDKMRKVRVLDYKILND
jgi:hypothetical protein